MYVFRKVDNKAWWSKERDDGEEWLAGGQLRADILKDLRTTSNGLSFYFLENLDDATLNRVIAACAAPRDNLVNLDYVIAEMACLVHLPIAIKANPGETFDPEVNKWHRDFNQLSANCVVGLAASLVEKGTFARKSWKDVGRLLKNAIEQGACPPDKLRLGVREKLELL